MSITTEPFELPPICRIFLAIHRGTRRPAAYDDENCPTRCSWPVPAGLTWYMLPLVS